MNWRDDPEIVAEVKRRGVRAGLIRSALLWTPLFLISAGAFIFFFIDTVFGLGYGGTWFLLVVLGVLAVLFGFQASQSLLDLRAAPVDTKGYVTRRWSRSDSLVMRSHYIRLENQILRGDAVQLADIKEGNYVAVTYYPHSAVIVWVEKAAEPEDEGE